MRLALIIILLVSSCDLRSAILYARNNGDWDNNTLWSLTFGGASCGCVPGSADIAVIDGYDVRIDVNTGNVTVLAIVIASDSRNDHASLDIEDGVTVNVLSSVLLYGNMATRDQFLTLTNNNTHLNIADDLLIIQNTGDDIYIDVDDSGTITVGDDFDIDKNGGDDIHLHLNASSGTSGTIDVNDDFRLHADNFNSDGIEFYVNETNSLFNVDGDFTLITNSATSDAGIVWFDLNDGNMVVDGVMTVTRLDDCGNINFDLTAGDLTAGDLVINSAGTLGTDAGVFINLDGASQMNIINDLDVNMTGGDDFDIRINLNSGTTAALVVGGDFTIDRSSGDDINILLDDDNSLVDVGGDFIITSTGGEQLTFDFDNTADLAVGGNFAIQHSNGQNIAWTHQGGFGDAPVVNVAGNYSIMLTGGADNVSMNLNSGSLNVGGNVVFSQGAGTSDFAVFLENSATFNVGADFTATLEGGDDMTFGLGEGSASSAKFDVGGHMQLIHNNNVAASLMYLRILDASEVEAGQLTLTTNFTAPAQFLTTVANTAVLDVDGNLNLNAPGAGELEVDIGAGARLELMGNIVRAASPSKYGAVDCSSGGTIEYNGSSAQVFAQTAGNGGDNVTYYNVIVNNSAASAPMLTMEGLATINNNITFTDGIIASATASILAIADNATASGASDASHVDGPVQKVGNDAFTFPVGNGGNYQPIAISAPGVVTNAFTAQYFHQIDPRTAIGNNIAGTLDHISGCEYWTLDRTSGASNVLVTLAWDVNSCGVTNMAALRVARWNGTQWVNHGNGGTTGTNAAGTIVTSAAVTAFSPFTLASSTAANPLPVELLDITAVSVAAGVRIDWTTVNEQNLRLYTLERSADAQAWNALCEVPPSDEGAAIKNYQCFDLAPEPGITYYRLRQEDFDATFKYSKVVYAVTGTERELSLYPNPSSDGFMVLGLKGGSYQLYSSAGILLKEAGLQSAEKTWVDTSDLQEGLYLIRAQVGDENYSRVVVIQRAE